MQRGYRDVGYLLAGRLRGFRPAWLDACRWRGHLDTLLQSLAGRHERHVWDWLAITYPGLARLVPVDQRQHFVAGMRERVCGG